VMALSVCTSEAATTKTSIVLVVLPEVISLIQSEVASIRIQPGQKNRNPFATETGSRAGCRL
jgi:hypothetical protein